MGNFGTKSHMYRNIHSHNNKNAHFTAQKQDCHHTTKKGQKPKFPTPYRPKIPHFISSHPPSSAPHLSLITSPLHHHHHIPLRHHLITHSPLKHCPFSNNALSSHQQCIAKPSSTHCQAIVDALSRRRRRIVMAPSTHCQGTVDALSRHQQCIVSTWPMYGLHKKNRTIPCGMVRH